MKCHYCKKEGGDLVKYHTADGVVRYIHKGECIERHMKWETYMAEENER